MDNQFPQMLYRAPGSQEIHGGRFDTLVVENEKEHQAALADGWHESTPDAKAAHEAAIAEALTGSQQGSASNEGGGKPTREELEQKAAELGIAFSAKVSDKKLAEAIATKLEGGGK